MYQIHVKIVCLMLCVDYYGQYIDNKLPSLDISIGLSIRRATAAVLLLATCTYRLRHMQRASIMTAGLYGDKKLQLLPSIQRSPHQVETGGGEGSQ